MLFTIGIVAWIFIGVLLVGLAIGLLTLHYGEGFQETYAKGVVWKVVADAVFVGGVVLLILIGKWVGETTGLL